MVPSLILAVSAPMFTLLLSAPQPCSFVSVPCERRVSTKFTSPLIAVALMYFCVKLIRYSFLFWLPLYMTEVLQYSPVHSGYASAVYELAGLVGVLFAGYVSE